jgi:hypothetical protein
MMYVHMYVHIHLRLSISELYVKFLFTHKSIVAPYPSKCIDPFVYPAICIATVQYTSCFQPIYMSVHRTSLLTRLTS